MLTSKTLKANINIFVRRLFCAGVDLDAFSLFITIVIEVVSLPNPPTDLSSPRSLYPFIHGIKKRTEDTKDTENFAIVFTFREKGKKGAEKMAVASTS